MKQNSKGILHFLLAFLSCTATLIGPVHADELSELYLNSSNNDSSSAIGANILIVLDTSESMTKHGVTELGFTVDPETYWGEAYDPDRTYPGPCDPNLAYRHSFNIDRDGDTDYDLDDVADEDFEECDGEQNFPLTAMNCKAVLENGVAVDRFGEFRPRTLGPNSNYTFNGKVLDGEWESMNDSFNGVAAIDGVTVWRECASDAGIHGPSTIFKWPRDSAGTFAWTSNVLDAKNLDDESRQLVATGNYINYFRWAQTRLAAVQSALLEVISALPPETRLGVMRFDVKTGYEGSSDGAYVIKEFVELGENTLDSNGNTVISANRQALIDRLYEIDPADEGGTPLGESLFEALQVYRGGNVTFGRDAETWNIDPSVWPWDENTTDYVDVSSVTESRNSGDTSKYKSPIIFECQKNAVIFLSDGDPDGDLGTSSLFASLPDAAGYATGDCDEEDDDSCIREVADYMAHEDLLPLMNGDQTVTTYTVGFGTDISVGGAALLTEAAERGGGRFTQVTNYEDLKNAFQVIFRKEIASNETLSSPAVTVNAFNRLSHEDSLYFTMFDPIFDSVHWPGNVKKYRLAKRPDGNYRIVDARNNPALNDDSSAVRISALSYWTDPDSDPAIIGNGGQDGNKTKLGGAASKTGIRTAVYSWFGDMGNTDLTSTANAFSIANLTNATVGLDAGSDQLDELHRYMIGADVHDEDGDTVTNEPRRDMGASPHGIPAVVNYGNDEATATQVIYAPTNDGFLHAIDAEDGHELWSFVPMEVMHNFADIYQTPEEPEIAYGLDGSIIHHTEGAGSTEKKWLFFGMRRGGKSIYALDVTDKTAPKLMWRIRSGDTGFENLAQTWSDPRVARINVGGTPTTVLVFGGGYDASTQDSVDATAGYVNDIAGNALYIVNAEDGTLLWRAGPGGNLPLTGMKSSIAAPVELKDKNGDGLDDLIYAADLGGRIFRFDIGNTGSITGGMIASLGAGGLTDNRKFFNEPDVVLVAKDDLSYWAINIGSGDRERPKSNMTTQNYLFSIKDKDVFNAKTDYSDVITMDELYDATANYIQDPTKAAAERDKLLAAKGWKVALGHSGEKALARATTFDFRVFFTTFDPKPLGSADCNSQPGTARLYTMNLIDAGVPDADNGGVVSAGDRETVLSHGTIPPPVTIMFIKDEETGAVEIVPLVGRSDDRPDAGNGGAVRRTFWNVDTNDSKEQ